MKNASILIITPEFYPRNIGGGGIVYRGLAKELIRQGHQVSVFSGNYLNKGIFGSIEHFSDNDVEVFFFPLIPIRTIGDTSTQTYTPPTIVGLISLIRLFIKNSSDIIHLHGTGHPFVDIVALFCIFLRKDYVFTCHGIPKSPYSSGLRTRLLFELYRTTLARLVFRSAKAVTVVSTALLRECREMGLISSKMKVIPNGLERMDQSTHSMGVKIESKYSLKGKKLIFSIGRHRKVKGFQHLIMAMLDIIKEFPDTLAVIAGSGSYTNNLRNIVKDKNLSAHVKLTGWISEAEKWALYGRAEVVVFPSLYEPFGIVLLEALSVGKAIVASNLGAFSKLLQDKKTGFLVKQGNTKEIAEKVKTLLRNHQLRRKFEESAQKSFALHDWGNIVQLYIDTYLAQ